jgi:uncharacterized repeat protein (TIGR01451 family)
MCAHIRRREPGPSAARRAARVAALGLVLAVSGRAPAQQLPAGLSIRAVAEVETRAIVGGHEAIRLRPADRVAPGDQVLYTLEIRNRGTTPIAHAQVPFAIPEHMRYVADSAIGAGAQVSFSVDGGHRFDRPERLTVAGPKGVLRAATPADYTHIRWQFKQTLERDSVAFARFRAVVQ